MNYPRCQRCGSKTYTFIRELKSGKDTIYVYQDSNRCVHLLDFKIEQSENPKAILTPDGVI